MLRAPKSKSPRLFALRSSTTCSVGSRAEDELSQPMVDTGSSAVTLSPVSRSDLELPVKGIDLFDLSRCLDHATIPRDLESHFRHLVAQEPHCR
jgi:hypothetical protein